MDLKRTATIGLIGGALAAWLAAAATSGTRESAAPLIVKAPPIDLRGAALADEVARLHERLRPDALPRQPGRNLFEFSASRAKSARPAAPPAAPAAASPIAAAPPAPRLKLAGLAEDASADGVTVRTAIISTEGQLFLVKEGEAVTSRYRVAKISADVVELVDLLDNSTLRLALK